MYNLPPGVRVCDIPGNTHEDDAFEQLIVDVLNSASGNGLSAEDAQEVWRIGLKAHQRHQQNTLRRWLKKKLRQIHDFFVMDDPYDK